MLWGFFKSTFHAKLRHGKAVFAQVVSDRERRRGAAPPVSIRHRGPVLPGGSRLAGTGLSWAAGSGIVPLNPLRDPRGSRGRRGSAGSRRRQRSGSAGTRAGAGAGSGGPSGEAAGPRCGAVPPLGLPVPSHPSRAAGSAGVTSCSAALLLPPVAPALPGSQAPPPGRAGSPAPGRAEALGGLRRWAQGGARG